MHRGIEILRVLGYRSQSPYLPRYKPLKAIKPNNPGYAALAVGG